MSEVDWLSHLLQIVTVTGQLEVRCAYGAPWRLTWSRAAANEIPYHVIVKGRANVLSTSAEIGEAERAHLRPWTATQKLRYVRVNASDITGRRFKFGPEPDHAVVYD